MLELDITTNRVDCMNVYGVAREVAALYGLPLRAPETARRCAGADAPSALEVTIEAASLCGRFCARLLDVKIGPSPAWLRDRLELVGIRAINNVVDLTNYVMIELGQPSHAFDLARVPGGSLVVRWSREGERLTTLDGQQRTLPARVGVIAGKGGEPALALAGIMGGASSEIHEGTGAGGARGGLVGAARDPARRPRARHAHRGVAPLRARRRHRRGAAGARPARAPGREDRRRQRAARPRGAHERRADPERSVRCAARA